AVAAEASRAGANHGVDDPARVDAPDAIAILHEERPLAIEREPGDEAELGVLGGAAVAAEAAAHAGIGAELAVGADAQDGVGLGDVEVAGPIGREIADAQEQGAQRGDPLARLGAAAG